MINNNWHIGLFMLAAGLLAGCSADTSELPVANETQEEIKIHVSSTSTTDATRATIINDNTDLQGQDVRIDAYFHGTTTNFLDGAKVSYNTVYSTWLFYETTWTHYYWPIEGSVHSEAGTGAVDFVGYVPYTTPSYISNQSYTAGHPSFVATLPITSGTPNTFDETNQSSLQEYMYAYTDNQTRRTNSGIVNLQFEHPFALVYFYLGKAKRNTTINSVTLSGLKTRGTCTFNSNSVSGTEWSSLDTEANLLITVGKHVPAQLNFNALIGGPYLVIPQTLSGTDNLIVNQTYNGIPSTPAATLSGTWEPGKIYSYYLDLGVDENAILVRTTIEEWATCNYKTPIDVN